MRPVRRRGSDVVAVIEHGTVTGNVSRTHKPCGACGELVEVCAHTRPGTPRTLRGRSDAARAAAKASAELRKARAQREIADMRGVLGGDR